MRSALATLLVSALLLPSAAWAKQLSKALQCMRLLDDAKSRCMVEAMQKPGRRALEKEKKKSASSSSSVRAAGAPVTVLGVEETVPGVTDADHRRGKAGARIVLVEYGDFECPFCKRHLPTLNDVLKAYPNDVAMVFRHFPLPFHRLAQKESEAAECAARVKGEQAFWAFHDALYDKGYEAGQLTVLAASHSVDPALFRSCLENGGATDRVLEQFEEGKAAGVRGTPTTFVIDTKTNTAERVLGAAPVERFRGIIDGMLKK